jgi:uncharacterized membrane protein YphA (DoxX/SURF4 family)
VIIAASVVLGVIFLASGVLKVSAPVQWRTQSAGLGVPWSLAAIVPYLESAVGALLVTQIARRPVAAVAGVLLLAFTTLIVLRLHQGRRPPCACFGAWTTKPIGWRNVVRNGAFFALAVVIAASGG